MAWVNNNKRNARFNPNRKDDRLMESQVIVRREHKKKKEAEPIVELLSTDPAFVLSMEGDCRVDWLQMALMQAGLGQLKSEKLYDILVNPAFAPSEAEHRKTLKATVLSNTHLFSSKQQKKLTDAVSKWESGGGQKEKAARARSRSSGSGSRGSRGSRVSRRSGSPERRRKREGGEKAREKEKEKDRGEKEGREKQRRRRSPSRSRSRSGSRKRAASPPPRSRSRGRRRRDRS